MQFDFKVLRKLSLITSLAFSNYFFQFLFNWTIIVSLGAGINTDVFFSGIAIPQLFLNVITGTLTYVMIPAFSKLAGRELLKEAWNFFHLIAAVFVILIAILYLTSPYWVRYIYPGFTAADLKITLQIFHIQLPGIFFSSLISVLWALNNSQLKFVKVETTSLITNVIFFILIYIALPKYGVIFASWLLVFKSFFQLLLLISCMGRYSRFNRNSVVLKSCIIRVRPLILGSFYYKSDQIIDKFLLSTAPIGILTLFNVTQQVYGAGSSIISRCVVSTIIPVMATSTKFYQVYVERMKLLLLFTVLPFLIGVIIGCINTKFLMPYLGFNPGQISKLWMLLILSSGFWFGSALGGLSSAAFYSQNDTKTPTRISIVTFTLYIPLKFLAFKYYGVYGLSICMSGYFICNFLIQHLILRKRYAFN